MSRYQRILTKEQMAFLIKNSHWTNRRLAKELETTKQIIAVYKYRARKAGINIPNQIKSSEIEEDFKELAKLPKVMA